jgi:hypothetical protein
MNFKKIIGVTILFLLGLTFANTCTQGNLFQNFLNFSTSSAQKSCRGHTSDFSPFSVSDYIFLSVVKENINQEILSGISKGSTLSFLLYLTAVSLVALLASSINSKNRIRKLKRSPPRLYCKWTTLFRRGILHPKIFFKFP